MKLVVGLGNPGKKYQGTRHNVGFVVMATVAQQQSAGPVRNKFQGETTDFGGPGGRAMLLCPSTYMNRSGQSVKAAIDFYKLQLDDLLVVCDDLNLPVGRIRFRSKGSAGGQKGLADIIRKVGSDEFARLRIGIGSPPDGWDAADYVLGRFHNDELATIDEAIQRAAHGVIDWLAHDTNYCMNQYNGA